MKRECYTCYLIGMHKSFTASRESVALRKAKDWMEQNKIKCDYFVEETTDKYIEPERKEEDD